VPSRYLWISDLTPTCMILLELRMILLELR